VQHAAVLSSISAQHLLDVLGVAGVLLILFAETGLLVGFFLPGDSLLFTCGLLIATDAMDFPLWAAVPLICLAAVLGDQAGYLFGKKVGPSLFTRPDSRLFKQENVVKAHEFFEKYGPKSLVLARFVPIVRTFTPIIAGVSGMRYRPFLTFNVIGGVLWGAGVTLLGSWLGKIEFVNKHIELILILIVLVSVVPIMIEFLRARSQAKKNPPQESHESDGPDASQDFPDFRARPAAPVMDDATRPLRVPPVHEGRDASYGRQDHDRSYDDQGHGQSYGNQGGHGQSYGNQNQGRPYANQGHGQPYGDQAQQGDLLFYASDVTNPATIHHVALYMGDNTMVEAPYSGEAVRVRPVPWNYAELVPLATRPGTTRNVASRN